MSKNSGITASLEPREDGKFLVNLAADNNGKPFSCSITVDDEAVAVKICKQWKKVANKASGEFLKLFN